MECFAEVGDGVRLCYEVFGAGTGAEAGAEAVAEPRHGTGPVEAPTIVLVMGLGLDLLWWRDEFCVLLAARGYRVVRFDNRDVGRSTHFAGPAPNAWQYLRRRAPVTYTLEDMADDTGGLIDAIAPHGAHLVGVSLGSFIAQATAIRYPDRVRSLVSIMGRPGDRRHGKSAKRMAVSMVRAPKKDPVDELVAAFNRIGSTGRSADDESDVRSIAPRSLSRDDDRTGSGRQLAAIFAEQDRTVGLQGLSMAALVIHGERDRVILPSGGTATAAAIPGAELMMVPGMGHDLARRLWPAVLDGIDRTVRKGQARARP